MMLIILLLGLFAISTTDACGQCGTKHPQQHFCDADFAMKVRIVDVSHGSDIANRDIITATVLTRWKRGPTKGEFQFYKPVSFCGTNFLIDQTYVVTGTKEISPEGKYWSHGSCDFASLWTNLPGAQKVGFRKEYKKMCEDCEVSLSRSAASIRVDDLANDYSKASTFWTPTECYYNPHQTQLFIQSSKGRVVDCEDVYGVCAMNNTGQCNWQMTEEYEECFQYRDDYVIAKTGDFAFTDISQCQLLQRKKRKKCRKLFQDQQNELSILLI